MTQALLVLDDGPLVPQALGWAREAGLETLFLAPSTSPARRLAHEFHPLGVGEVAPAVALARRLANSGRLRGVLASTRRALGLLAVLAEAAPEVLAPRRAHLEAAELPTARLALLGIPTAPATSEAACFDVQGFLRDGVLAGTCVLERAARSAFTFLPPALSAAEALRLEQLTAEAARALGFTHGPLQATWQARADGFALVELVPTWLSAEGATHAARLALGKSPLQAWFAHLADAGGPFDELPRRARRAVGLTTLAGRLPAELGDLGPVRRLPGVLELVRATSAESPRRPARLTVVVEARDRAELETRLRRARAALEERIACTPAA